ncbi:MAG: stage II sporulation protein P [Eubacterium sp.]|nr:stage II sporulation protein P [Eubacterium sp.]
MDQTKHQLIMLEILLFLIFITIWAGIITGRIGRVSRSYDLMKDKLKIDENVMETSAVSFVKAAHAELIPALSDTSDQTGSMLFLPLVREMLQKETFPIQRYSKDYWKENTRYEAEYSDKVPDYFLESDETNEEPKKKDPGIMPEIGSGKQYTLKELSDRDFLLNNFYIVDESTRMTEEETDGRKLARKDLSLDTDTDKPLVLIYHTHGSESYRKENGKTGTVVDAGNVLARELDEKYHIKVIHDTTIYDMVNGQLDRSLAYNYAGEGVSAILKKNPSIQVVIDLHRDSVDDHHRLVTDINGQKAAKIMFFNGVSRRTGTGEIDYLYNPNKIANLSFSLQMQLLAASYYPGLTRKIYIKGYRYNLHLKERAMLVEVGAQNNTLSEAEHAMGPLAELLYRLLSGEKCYRQQ